MTRAPVPVVWLLDVDGVLNVTLPDPRVHQRVQVHAQGVSVRVVFDPDVVAAVNALADRGVRLVWLTTWGADAAAVLAPAIGLAGAVEALAPAQGPVTASDPRGGIAAWKREAALAFVAREEPTALIWTDDDLGDDVRAELTARWAGPALLLAPDPRIGLTSLELGRIERFIERVSSPQ